MKRTSIIKSLLKLLYVVLPAAKSIMVKQNCFYSSYFLLMMISGSIFIGGDEFTVNAGPYHASDAEMAQTAGPSYRQIISFSKSEESLFILPMGESGNEFAFEYDNLLNAWSQGIYRVLSLARHEGDPAHCHKSQILLPYT